MSLARGNLARAPSPSPVDRVGPRGRVVTVGIFTAVVGLAAAGAALWAYQGSAVFRALTEAALALCF